MNDKHTPRLLAVNPLRPDQICTSNGSHEIAAATMHSVATAVSNARRLVACWNACQGISTEELVDIANTGGMLGPREDITRIAGQRNELLEALKGLMALSDHRVDLRDAAKAARAAIAKATGEPS